MSDSLVKNIFISLRPKQWTKNILIFAALVFSQKFFNLKYLSLTIIGFLLLCFISGSIYIFNDINDVKRDKLHPKKSKRPIASGRIPIQLAFILFVLFSLTSLIFSFLIGKKFGIVILMYLILQITYSLILKNIAIVDIFVIAFGFVLRVVAGGEIISVPLSSWLLICTLFLSLFLALGKRRYEFISMENNVKARRISLNEYDINLLDQMITVVTSSTVVAYALYTLSAETVSKFKTTNLKYTIPFVLYGVFRYLYLIYHKEAGENPEEILLTDTPLIINLILYALAVGIIIY